MSTVAKTVLDKSHLQLKGAVLKVFPLAEMEESPDDLMDASHSDANGQGMAVRQGDTRGQDVSRRQGDTRRQDVSRRQGDTCGQDVSQNQSRPDDKSHRQAKSDRQEESDKRQRKTNVWDEKTIEVTRLKPGTTGDAILLLFESKLPEVVILLIQRHPNKDVIYITFETDDG